MASQPLLGGNVRAQSRLQDNPLTRLFYGGIIAPSSTTYDSIYELLNAKTRAERDELTKAWRDHKLDELNFVGTVGALLASCLSSTGSWPDVLANGRDKPWSVRACWYSGIALALCAVLTALQQSLRLHRLSAHRDGLRYVRRCMSHARDGPAGTGVFRPRRWQVYAWQASFALLAASVACMLAGMAVLVWVGAAYGPEKTPEDGWWDDGSKMAVAFTVVLGAIVFIMVAAQASLSLGGIDEDGKDDE